MLNWNKEVEEIKLQKHIATTKRAFSHCKESLNYNSIKDEVESKSQNISDRNIVSAMLQLKTNIKDAESYIVFWQKDKAIPNNPNYTDADVNEERKKYKQPIKLHLGRLNDKRKLALCLYICTAVLASVSMGSLFSMLGVIGMIANTGLTYYFGYSTLKAYFTQWKSPEGIAKTEEVKAYLQSIVDKNMPDYNELMDHYQEMKGQLVTELQRCCTRQKDELRLLEKNYSILPVRYTSIDALSYINDLLGCGSYTIPQAVRAYEEELERRERIEAQRRMAQAAEDAERREENRERHERRMERANMYMQYKNTQSLDSIAKTYKKNSRR